MDCSSAGWVEAKRSASLDTGLWVVLDAIACEASVRVTSEAKPKVVRYKSPVDCIAYLLLAVDNVVRSYAGEFVEATPDNLGGLHVDHFEADLVVTLGETGLGAAGVL